MIHKNQEYPEVIRSEVEYPSFLSIQRMPENSTNKIQKEILALSKQSKNVEIIKKSNNALGRLYLQMATD